jgi:hypothetical protein
MLSDCLEIALLTTIVEEHSRLCAVQIDFVGLYNISCTTAQNMLAPGWTICGARVV